MLARLCNLCTVYRITTAHHPERGQVCESCRYRLERDRLAVKAMYLRLLEERDLPVDLRLRGESGKPCDPVAYILPMAVTSPVNSQPIVTGSQDPVLPIDVHAVDLTAAAQIGTVSDPHGDQVGVLSVASVLYDWVRNWAGQFYPAQTLPPPDPVGLLDWLGRGRLEQMCDADGSGIEDFAADLIELRTQLRRALKEDAPRPAVMWGVACRRCDLVSQLILDLDDPDRWRECRNCGLLMSQQEYQEWLIELVEQHRVVDRTQSVVADDTSV